MKVFVLALGLLAAATAAPPAVKRTVQDNVLRSPRDPEITLKVAEGFQYLGSFPFTLEGIAGGERHVWVDAGKDRRIRRMFILQFEGFFEGTGRRYSYTPRNVTRLGENDYNSNGFFYRDLDLFKERPGTEAERTRSFVEEKGYRLDPEQMLYRFYRSLPEDHRNEFLIFYIQPLAELGISLEHTSENQDTAREKELLAAARERALQAFTVMAH
ncbi:MAG TPA: hypothetical protein VFV75_19800 [Candidatus Polarisedimenticolaceae bacterium]|nr:hypothetical protein [Candidatus Polarisedimenticolaceae bacterium]